MVGLAPKFKFRFGNIRELSRKGDYDVFPLCDFLDDFLLYDFFTCAFFRAFSLLNHCLCPLSCFLNGFACFFNVFSRRRDVQVFEYRLCLAVVSVLVKECLRAFQVAIHIVLCFPETVFALFYFAKDIGRIVLEIPPHSPTCAEFLFEYHYVSSNLCAFENPLWQPVGNFKSRVFNVHFLFQVR